MKPLISRRDAIEAIYAWGEVIREYGDNTPDGWGWTGTTIEWRMAKGAGGGKAEFTLPEGAIYMLQRRGIAKEMALTVAILVKAMPWIQSICVALKYVHQLDEESIRMQTGATTRELRRHIESAQETVFIALNGLKQVT